MNTRYQRTWLSGAALVTSLGSLAMSGYLATQVAALRNSARPNVMTVGGEAAAAREASPAEAQLALVGLARLGERLSAVEARVAAGAQTGGGGGGGGGVPSEAGGSAGSAAMQHEGPVRYTHFEVPVGGVTVRQEPSGALRVDNRDPALDGQMMVVKGLGEDGELRELAVVVPPAAP